MMKRFTTLALVAAALLLSTQSGFAQDSEFLLNVPTSDDFTAGYTTGLQSGGRAVAGPFDLDGDGLTEILVSDYSGGGRVHVIENVSIDTWELVYSTPWLDSTATTFNIRAIAGGDLDGDGFGEIVFQSGRNFSPANPNIDLLPPGIYVFENVGDNDFGTSPTSVYQFDETTLPDRWRSEQMTIADIDGDGLQELMFGNNGAAAAFDNWYILSVTDLGTSGFEVWRNELILNSGATDETIARGGGSPYAIHPADLNGDGTLELSLHSWNFFNFTNIQVEGADSYTIPNDSTSNVFLQATRPDDHVSFFGGVVVDIDGDGDDEIFYPNNQTGNVAVLNYDAEEDVLQVTQDNLTLDVIPGLTTLGIVAADLDGDGNMELIGTGSGYTEASRTDGAPAAWINISEFNGGDPEDPGSYSTVTPIFFPSDNYEAFHVINRLDSSIEYVDNAADVSIRNDVVLGNSNPEFASKFVHLGDADNDGFIEVAFGIQGVRDTLYTFTEVAAESLIVASATVNENRIFLRVLSGSGLAVSIQDERIVLPSDYKLHANYPNPFNPTTTFSFTLPLEKAVSVRIYDITGRLVRTLVNNQVFPAGTFDVSWDGTSDAGTAVASGSYLYSLEYGNFRQSRTMVLAK